MHDPAQSSWVIYLFNRIVKREGIMTWVRLELTVLNVSGSCPEVRTNISVHHVQLSLKESPSMHSTPRSVQCILSITEHTHSRIRALSDLINFTKSSFQEQNIDVWVFDLRGVDAGNFILRCEQCHPDKSKEVFPEIGYGLCSIAHSDFLQSSARCQRRYTRRSD